MVLHYIKKQHILCLYLFTETAATKNSTKLILPGIDVVHGIM